MLRRAGFVATLVAGVALFGASVHGITNVDHELKLAAATPAAPQTESVDGSRVRDCDKRERERHHPEV